MMKITRKQLRNLINEAHVLPSSAWEHAAVEAFEILMSDKSVRQKFMNILLEQIPAMRAPTPGEVESKAEDITGKVVGKSFVNEAVRGLINHGLVKTMRSLIGNQKRSKHGFGQPPRMKRF